MYNDYIVLKSKWFDKLPAHWGYERLKNILVERKEKNDPVRTDFVLSLSAKMGVTPYNERTEKGGNKPKEDLSKYNLAYPNDLLVNCMNIVSGAAGVSKWFGAISPVYYALYPRGENDSIWYYQYIFRLLPFQRSLIGMGKGILMHESSTGKLNTVRMRIPMGALNNVILPIPPSEEQTQIVKYLDWQSSRINKLINVKKKQIALLEEQKQGIVNAIALGGAAENPERKDSGVAWIGQIPAHWDAVRCKYLFAEINDRSEEGLETHLSMSQKYGLVPDSMLDERRMLSASYAGGKLCQEGDLVLNRLKAHLGVFALAPMEGVISPDYTVLRPNREYILPEFAEAVLKCTKCRPELRIRVRGIVEGFWRLYTDDFNTIYIPLPPIEEQRSIMKAIAAKQEHLNKLIKAINQEIELLQEYRTRLISDVVTGQVDVRDVAIPEYEAVQELAEEEDDTFADETEMEDE